MPLKTHDYDRYSSEFDAIVQSQRTRETFSEVESGDLFNLFRGHVLSDAQLFPFFKRDGGCCWGMRLVPAAFLVAVFSILFSCFLLFCSVYGIVSTYNHVSHSSSALLLLFFPSFSLTAIDHTVKMNILLNWSILLE